MSAYDLTWHKSSYSNPTGGNCVEVAEVSDAVLVRDTQNRELGHLGFSSSAWSAFVHTVKADVL